MADWIGAGTSYPIGEGWQKSTSGSFTSPQLSITPVVSAGTIVGHQSGSFTSPQVSTQPVVSVGSIAGIPTGTIAAPQITTAPVITTGELTGQQSGFLLAPQLSIQPIVSVGTLTALNTIPFIITPEEGEFITQPYLFEWTAIAEATSYQLQITTDSLYTTIVVDVHVLGTTHEISGLADEVKHYGRVRARAN